MTHGKYPAGFFFLAHINIEIVWVLPKHWETSGGFGGLHKVPLVKLMLLVFPLLKAGRAGPKILCTYSFSNNHSSVENGDLYLKGSYLLEIHPIFFTEP